MTEQTGSLGSAENWEDRQRLAAFHQARLVALQTGAIAGATCAMGVWPIGVSLGIYFHAYEPVLSLTAIFWFGLTLRLLRPHARSAMKINQLYLEEHRQIFGDAPPYPLMSFLLSLAFNLRMTLGSRSD